MTLSPRSTSKVRLSFLLVRDKKRGGGRWCTIDCSLFEGCFISGAGEVFKAHSAIKDYHGEINHKTSGSTRSSLTCS